MKNREILLNTNNRLPPLQNYFLQKSSPWWVINFLFKEKSSNFIVLFSRNPDFCFFEIHRSQNLWRHHGDSYIMEVTLMLFFFFFWNLSNIKMKFGQILVCCMKKISNTLFARCWRLETSSRPFYNFIKMSYNEI